MTAQHHRWTRERATAVQAYMDSLPKSLGKTQRDVLKNLVESGSWHLGCGWRYGTPLGTVRHLEGLVKRGLAIRTEGKQEYWPMVQFDEAGKEISINEHNQPTPHSLP